MVVGLVELEVVVLVVDDRAGRDSSLPARQCATCRRMPCGLGWVAPSGPWMRLPCGSRKSAAARMAGGRRLARDQAGADQQLALRRASCASSISSWQRAAVDDRMGEGDLAGRPRCRSPAARCAAPRSQQPVDGVGHGCLHRRLVAQRAALLAVEQAEDHGHAQAVAGRDHVGEPCRPSGLQRAVGREAADPPRLVPGVALRAAALRG